MKENRKYKTNLTKKDIENLESILEYLKNSEAECYIKRDLSLLRNTQDKINKIKEVLYQ